jgi:hypothetical protein
MDALDILTIDGRNGHWLASAETVSQALKLMERTGPGKYLVYSQRTQEKNFYKVTPDGSVVCLVTAH